MVVSAPEQAQLDDLLFQRMMAKKKRDYDAADRVQQLLRDAGVYVGSPRTSRCGRPEP